MMNNEIDVYLASQSPRRRELLTQIGVRFASIFIDVPEQRCEGEPPEEYVQRLAQEKAKAGSLVAQDKPVIGADTIVVVNNKVLEKPATAEEGITMLMSLSGQIHHVMTAVCLQHDGREQLRLNKTMVRFRSIQLGEAQRYWRTGEPADKAGGYGIQGLAAVFVDSINGSYSSVVGLPLLETAQLLQAFQVPIWQST